MTINEFQQIYHDYQTLDQAKAEAEKVNEKAVGFRVVIIEMPSMGWCLILESAANELQAMGIV